MMASVQLFTVGHSVHELGHFLDLLKRHGIEAVADVRSEPHSQHAPQFNREVLEAVLKQQGIRYVFLGRELGARREERGCYVAGKARYELIARSPLFVGGLERVRRGAGRYRLTLMCAEKDPITCHRTILVCRNLRGPGVEIQHILEDGRLEPHGQAERRLLELMRLPAGDLFRGEKELIEQAYELQGEKIAYVEEAGQ